MTTMKLATLLFIIVLAFAEFDSSNYEPFFIEEYGFMGTVMAASMVFYGYLGFDFITTVSDDAQKPITDIPRSISIATLSCLVLYLLTSVSLAGMAKLQNFNPDTAMADAFTAVGYEWATYIIYLCALFGILAACFGNLIS
jgi:APA family basic amino acid/polyamine antiporter